MSYSGIQLTQRSAKRNSPQIHFLKYHKSQTDKYIKELGS